MSLEPLDASTQPYWLPNQQPWAVAQERMRHTQAMYSFGEYAMFVLMWRVEDFEAGLVDRCPTCFTAYGKMAETFAQPAKRDCPDCFGSTFEGGYKAKIVRPSMWDTGADQTKEGRRGEDITNTVSLQSTPDFRMRTDDYIFRGDGSRWQVRQITSDVLETGFGRSSDDNSMVGYNYGSAAKEDPSSVSYLIPPVSSIELRNALDRTNIRYPQDYSMVDEVRGPLL